MMTEQEAILLLKKHRNGNIKPTQKVKEAIDFFVSQPKKVVVVEDIRVKTLQNRCFIAYQGVLCNFCTMECEHKSKRGKEQTNE